MPNFGYEGVGGVSWNFEDYVTGSVFTCLQNGLADSITARLYVNTTTVNVRCLLYQHSDLHLIGETEEQTLAGLHAYTSFAFNFTGPRPVLYKNIEYCLEIWASSTSGVIYIDRVDAGETDQAHYQILTYNGAPNPLSVTHGNRTYCIYCTYTLMPTATPSGRHLYRKPSYFEANLMRRDVEDIQILSGKRDRI